MAKQNSTKDIEKQDTVSQFDSQDSVNQFSDSQEMRADLDTKADDTPWKDESTEPQHQISGRFQEDRNVSRR